MAELNSRREYGAARRGVVIRELTKEKSFAKYTRLIEKEVELDGILIDKIGFSRWDKNIDVGFAIQKNKLCVQLSVLDKKTRKFKVKETIKYTTNLDLREWTLRCVWEYYLKHR